MLTGRPPFESGNSLAVLKKISDYNENHFIYPPGLSYLAVDFMRCCLKKNPKQRANVY